MPEKNLALRLAILRALSEPHSGVARMAKELRVGPSSLIGEMADMRESGLLDFGSARTGSRGRPRRSVVATALGTEYLRSHERLERIIPRSRRSDLRRAALDGEYAARLAAGGVSPYALFFELNAIARRA